MLQISTNVTDLFKFCLLKTRITHAPCDLRLYYTLSVMREIKNKPQINYQHTIPPKNETKQIDSKCEDKFKIDKKK